MLSIQSADNVYTISTHDNLTLPALWLRERAQSADQVDANTQQRLFNSHSLAPTLAITDAKQSGDTLTIGFSDGYQGEYSITKLLADCQPEPIEPNKIIWQAKTVPNLHHDWLTISQDDARFFKAVKDFLTYGFIIIDNTPVAPESILAVATRFGYVRDTNFGRYFEVYSRPNANDLAYTSHAIGPHTDNPYRDPVPGIQLLHCLYNDSKGGESTLVDSLAVLNQLRQEEPKGYELLATVPIRFRFFDADTSLISYHTIIETDDSHNVLGIHYSPRLDDLPLLPEPTLQLFQRARNRLNALLNDPQYEIEFKLKTGQLMMFDNNRVLHGRRAFDPSTGKRHVQGCYIDRDAPKSHYQLLNKKYQ